MAQLPQGMTEDDYEAIEAAVTETVRGRWFLNEFARRNRAGEMREILAAVTRLEGTVGAAGTQQQTLLPADPSVRLLMQRVKEIGGQLDRLAGEMRLADADERFIAKVEEQGRAVTGMMRGPTLPTKPVPVAPPPALAAPLPAPSAAAQARPQPALPAPPGPQAQPEADPRLRHLEAIDRLSLPEKLALFA